MHNYKISIIVPIYNNEKFLRRCIESIVNQSYENLEIILVDDGSTDSSSKICDEYAKIDKRIRVIHKANEGVGAARNKGLDIATGDYVTFVDSDDFINFDMYERLLNVAINGEADIVQCGYNRTDESGRIITKHELKRQIIVGRYESSYYYVRGENTTNYVVNKLYKKKIIEHIRFPNSIVSEDFVFNVQAYYNCEKTIVVSGALYNYVINKNSVCNRNFHLGRLDAIKMGKFMYKFHKERFKDLCPFFALYITKYCMRFYREIRKSEIQNKKKYLAEIENEFHTFYHLITGNAYSSIKRKRTYFAMKIFKINPLLYCLLMDILENNDSLSF